MTVGRNSELLAQAQKVIPGGVNSPVRAFGPVGIEPRFIARASGSHIWDIEDNEYIDYVGSWGPLILGHAHPDVVQAVCQAASKGTSFGAPTAAEVELAQLICHRVSSVEMLRLVNSGTEATMTAVRLARAFTNRSKIIKFTGGYHGHADSFLVKAGSGAATLGTPTSSGVPQSVVADTLTAEVLEPEVLNPEEEALVRISLEPPAKPGTTGWIVITPPEGSPTNIAFPNTCLYVVDDSDEAVYMYDRAGTYQGSYPRAGQNDDAEGITTHGPRFFVADDNDDDTYPYAADMYYLGRWSLTSGNGNADGITTNGVNIWVVDGGDDSVYKYDMDGSFIEEIDLRSGNRDAGGITTDGAYIWVVDTGDDSAYKYDMDMAFIAELDLAPGNGNPRGIATNENQIWVVDRDDDSIYSYDMDMNPVSQFSLTSANANPAGIAVAPR